MRPSGAPDSPRDGAQALTGADTAAISAFSEAMRQHRPGHPANPDLMDSNLLKGTIRPGLALVLLENTEATGNQPLWSAFLVPGGEGKGKGKGKGDRNDPAPEASAF